MTVPAIEAHVNYLAATGERPVSYTFEPPPGIPPFSGRRDARAVRIGDARSLAEHPTLDREGFARVDHATAVRDFDDDAQVRGTYYAEVEALLRRETGAVRVVIFDHTLRSTSPERRAEKQAREPVRSVHNDYTAISGRRRVTDHLDPVEAAERLCRRHAVINVWRSIRGEIEEVPLAVCDARSIAPADLVPTDLVYPDRVGEVYSVRYSPEHRWFYYPRLRSDEALLIKTYDSLEDGTARFSAHTAFDDPTTPAVAAPRESIEVRALVFF
jgi:hypothetical protein